MDCGVGVAEVLVAVGNEGLLIDEAARVDSAKRIQFGETIAIGLRMPVGIHCWRKEDTRPVGRYRHSWRLARRREEAADEEQSRTVHRSAHGVTGLR